MLQKIVVGLAALIVLAAAGGGGWWYAAERGWIAGKPNSPRKENFKAALDEHLRRTTNYYQRPCAPVDMNRPRDGMGPAEVRFDWTPAGFRAVADPRQPQTQRAGPRYAFFAKLGYMAAKALPDGSTEYTLTWKGYAASTGQPCFQMAGAERQAEILSFAKKRTENRVDIYEVVARAPHQGVEAWAQTPEFRQLFADQSLQRYLEPQPVAYELARGESGFEVIAEQGRALTTQMRNAIRPEVLTKLAGGVTVERVRAALDAYLASPQGAQQARLCLRLPESQQADESTLNDFRYRGPAGGDQPAPTFTFYNLLSRAPYVGQEPLRGYVLMRKLEELGHATSETLPAAAFREQPAAGVVRFTPTAAFLARFAQERCFPVGIAQVEEIARFDPLTETNLTPQFVARAKIKPYDEEAAKIVAALPHFARMQEAGGVLRGALQYHDSELRVVNLNPQFPMYFPDVSAVRLPVVEAPALKPGQKPAPVQKPAPPQAPRAVTRPQYYMPGFVPAPVQVAPAYPPPAVMAVPPGGLQQRAIGAPQRAQ